MEQEYENLHDELKDLKEELEHFQQEQGTRQSHHRQNWRRTEISHKAD